MTGLLRLVTAGSVDDGKSTLIGRLLFDSKAVFDDVLASVTNTSKRQNAEYLNLALFTDGLRAEREQGITIDVAYRYFATPKRKFILADSPGHVQYTRNMVTGASTADAAVLIVDARNGISEQSRRHAVIASLLGIRHLVICVNKMDLVGYSEEVFDGIRAEFQGFLAALQAGDAHFIPISALHGDNVVEPSAHMPWYKGAPLLAYLEGLEVSQDHVERPLRLPVQYVLRPYRKEYHDYRGYAGTIASGVLRAGQTVRVLPSGRETTVVAIEAPWGEVDEAPAGTAVSVRVADDLDISRGDMLVAPDSPPLVTQTFEATVCWMSERSELRPGAMLRIKHTTRSAKAIVTDLAFRTNISTLSAERGVDALRLNEIGRVCLKTSVPIMCDDYVQDRSTGSFILIDEATNDTVGAGMIGKPRFESSLVSAE